MSGERERYVFTSCGGDLERLIMCNESAIAASCQIDLCENCVAIAVVGNGDGLL